jgi:methylmalonyl-CoA mutase
MSEQIAMKFSRKFKMSGDSLMAKPVFSSLEFKEPIVDKASAREKWQSGLKRQRANPLKKLLERTMEQIDVRPLYTSADYENLTHLGAMAGIPPICAAPTRPCM